MSALTTATDPGTILLAEGLLEFINNKGTEAQQTVQTLTLLGAIAVTAVTAILSKLSLAKTLAAALVGGFVVFLVGNMTSVSGRVGEEIEYTGAKHAAAVVVDHAQRVDIQLQPTLQVGGWLP